MSARWVRRIKKYRAAWDELRQNDPKRYNSIVKRIESERIQRKQKDR